MCICMCMCSYIQMHPNLNPNPNPNQAAYYTLLATDGSLVHTDWNQTHLLGPNHPDRTILDEWNSGPDDSGQSDLSGHVPACPLPPEHMRWPTPREQEAEPHPNPSPNPIPKPKPNPYPKP